MNHSSTKRPYSFSIPRVLLCGVLLTALIAACLYLHLTAFEFYQARFLDTESKTLAWFTEQLSYSLPFIIICLFHLVVYHKHDRYDGVARKEMLWEVVMVTVLTYGVLLPCLGQISNALYTNALATGEIIPQTEAEVDITLLMDIHQWVIRLTIPLGILMVFHGVRANRELRHPESEAAEEPLLTVEEFEAQKAASFHNDFDAPLDTDAGVASAEPTSSSQNTVAENTD